MKKLSEVFVENVVDFQGVGSKEVVPDETFGGLGMDSFRLQQFLLEMEEKNGIVILNDSINITSTLQSAEEDIKKLITERLIKNISNN